MSEISLRERIEELEEENRQLRDKLFGGRVIIPEHWDLTRTQAAVINALAARQVADKGFILDCIEEANHSDTGDTDIKTVDVHICKMRQKLAPHGVVIETVWGRGYRLPAATRALLKGVAA